ncbi:MAG: DUF3565 domain-containing protein [Acidobacteriota bacterium]|nr:DUF3565 domain-containing protein [Acidobacteriota bacterium]
MKRKIVGYNRDNENDWRAELECGHFQHVRHKPPLVSRPWVLTEAGRNSRLGFELECKKCDEAAAVDYNRNANASI